MEDEKRVRQAGREGGRQAEKDMKEECKIDKRRERLRG